MNAIIGLAHLCERFPDIPKTPRDYIRKIHAAAVSLLGIINDILDSSKIESGRLDIEAIPFSLDDVLSHVLTITAQRAEDKGLTLAVNVPPDCPRELVGDPLRLSQIFINLVNNAIKFTETGGIELWVETGEVTDSHATLRFVVRDSGIGMTRAQLDSIFEPFVQADGSISRKYGGTGLGLSISRRLAAMMGGDIAVESTSGVGSSFILTITLPRSSEAPANRLKTTAPGAVPHYVNARILLVEDNETNQLIATELLKPTGLMVDVACSGEEALKCLGAHPADYYQLVLMDLQMPGMDGFSAARAIRKSPSYADLPIVALTAHASTEVQQRCFQDGMQGCLSKPFHPKQLFEAVDRWIDRSTEETPPGSLNNARDGVSAEHAENAGSQALDAAQGLSFVGNNAALYRRVLERFVVTSDELLRSIRDNVASKDLVAAQRAVHTLRGLAATIGAASVADSAAVLEQSLGDGAYTSAQLELIAQRLTLALAAIRRQLEADPS